MPEPDVLVAGLDGGLPVALLPVRLEARYFDDGRELRVRIYPDQIHVDAHERELTGAERDAGEAYWRSRLAGGSDAWPALCGAVRGAPRAAWVAHALTPTNLGQPGDPAFPSVDERPTVWSRPAVAKALPQQWVLVGTRAGTELFRVWTKPVTRDLPVSPDPGDETAPREGELPLQDAARWLADFDVAEQAGMAVRITGADVRDGVDRLVVLGVDWDLAPDDAARHGRRPARRAPAHRWARGAGAWRADERHERRSAGSPARRHRADGGARSRAPA